MADGQAVGGAPGMSLEEKTRAIVEDLQKLDPEKIILFGSAARGDTDPYSDLDVVVIRKDDPKRSWLQRGVEARTAIRWDVGAVDLFVYTPQEWETHRQRNSVFYEQVMKNAKVLYEKRSEG